jgi:hypothetical protein
MADSNDGFFATKERTTAWVFRAAITLAGFAGTTVLSLLLYQWTDFKDTVKEQNKAIWAAVSNQAKAVNDAGANLGVMQRTILDHIAQETEINGELKDEQKDHENRIRAIEHTIPTIDGH